MVFYASSDDPKLFVKNRYKLGWTLNWAHPKATLTLLIITMLTVFGSFVTILLMNLDSVSPSILSLTWGFFALCTAFLLFNLNLTKIYINSNVTVTALSYGVLASLLGFGLQGIFNGVPVFFWEHKNLIWIHHIYLGSMAAICQTIGKIIIICLLVKIRRDSDLNRTIRYGLCVGLGFTIAEIMLIIDYAIINKDQLTEIFLWERTSSSMFHIYSAAIIAISINARKYGLMIIPLAIHALSDWMAGAYTSKSLFQFSIETLESIFSLFAIATWFTFLFINQHINKKN